MTLQFAREVLIVKGFPVIGTVTVVVHAQREPSDGLWALDLEVVAFEPEEGRALTWGAVAGPIEYWLTSNRRRVEKKVLRGPEPCKTHFKRW